MGTKKYSPNLPKKRKLGQNEDNNRKSPLLTPIKEQDHTQSPITSNQSKKRKLSRVPKKYPGAKRPIESYLDELCVTNKVSPQIKIPLGWNKVDLSETNLKRFACLQITLVASHSTIDLQQKYRAALEDCVADFTDESVGKLLCIQSKYSNMDEILKHEIENAKYRLHPICGSMQYCHSTQPSELVTSFFQTFIDLHTLFGSGRTNG